MIFTSPEVPERYPLFDKFFLAGSINNGLTEDWQSEISEYLSKGGYTVFNPRRKDWNTAQDPKVITSYLQEQIYWELKHLEESDNILFYFADENLAPISLLELGLHMFSEKKNIYVVCNEAYPRYANVEITCHFYGLEVLPNLDEFKKLCPIY